MTHVQLNLLQAIEMIDKTNEIYKARITFNLFYLFLSVLGLHCCVRAFSSCGERELLFVAVHGLLIVVACIVAEHGL